MELNLIQTIKKQFRNIGVLMLMHSAVSIGLTLILTFRAIRMFSFYYAMQFLVVLSYAIPMLATIGVFLIGNAWLKPKIQKKDFRWKGHSFWKYFVILMGTNFFGTMVFQMIQNLIEILTHQHFLSSSGLSFTGVAGIDIFLILYIVLIGPIFEELLFRGVILRTLDRYHRVFAILISSLLFGLMHMNLVQSIVTFFIGCVLAYASLKEESLMVPIVLHILNNTISLLSSISFLSLLFWIGMIVCFVWMVILLHKNSNKLKDLFAYEYCDYTYGKWFFSRWSVIVYLIFAGILILLSI